MRPTLNKLISTFFKEASLHLETRALINPPENYEVTEEILKEDYCLIKKIPATLAEDNYIVIPETQLSKEHMKTVLEAYCKVGLIEKTDFATLYFVYTAKHNGELHTWFPEHYSQFFIWNPKITITLYSRDRIKNFSMFGEER